MERPSERRGARIPQPTYKNSHTDAGEGTVDAIRKSRRVEASRSRERKQAQRAPASRAVQTIKRREQPAATGGDVGDNHIEHADAGESAAIGVTTSTNNVKAMPKPARKPRKDKRKKQTLASETEGQPGEGGDMGEVEDTNANAGEPAADAIMSNTEDVTASSKKARKPRKDKGIKRPSKIASRDTSGGPEDSPNATAEAQPKKRTRKRAAEIEATTERTGEGSADSVAAEGNRTQEGSPKRKRRKRAETPEEHEPTPINTGATLMHELTRDVKVSKISNVEKQLRGIDWSGLRKKRKVEHEEAMKALVEDTRSGRTTLKAKKDDAVRLAEEAPDPSRTQEQIAVRQANGNVTFVTRNISQSDETPVDYDAEIHEGTVAQVVTETEYTTAPFNSRSKIHDRRRDNAEREVKYAKTRPWSEEDTEAFYSALSMWGTDFSIINALFPTRTRRQIKLKFLREERADPVRVNRALIQETVPMDIGKFAEMTGKEDVDFKEAKDVMDALETEKVDQMAQMEAEVVEASEAVKASRTKAKARQEAAAKKKKQEKELKTGKRSAKSTEPEMEGTPAASDAQQ